MAGTRIFEPILNHLRPLVVEKCPYTPNWGRMAVVRPVKDGMTTSLNTYKLAQVLGASIRDYTLHHVFGLAGGLETHETQIQSTGSTSHSRTIRCKCSSETQDIISSSFLPYAKAEFDCVTEMQSSPKRSTFLQIEDWRGD